MSRRVSPRAGLYAAASALLLLLAVVSARLEPLALAAPLLAALLLGLGGAEEPRLELHREIAGTHVFEGETTTVSITVRAETALPLLEVAGPLPEGASLVAGSPHGILSLGAGEERRLSYAFRMAVRCRYELGPTQLRVHAAPGLLSWEQGIGEWARCVVYPMPMAMRSSLLPRRTRASVGSYVSGVAGEGIDFLDLRPFAGGDQTRRINWRASARREEELVVNQFAAERNADVVLVLDVLTEIGPPGRSVLDMMARGAATLARHFLREKNRVGYLELGHSMHWVLPASSRRQWFRLLDLLAGLEVRERALTFELSSVPSRILPPGAFVVGFSSLANPRWARALTELKRRGHDVLIVCPWGPEVARACIDSSRETALALRIWELEQRAAVAELKHVGVRCVPWRPSEPFDLVIRAAERAQRSRRW